MLDNSNVRKDARPHKIAISPEARQRLQIYSSINRLKPTRVIEELIMGLPIEWDTWGKKTTEVDSKGKSLTPQSDAFFANSGRDRDVDDDLTAFYRKGK